MENNRKFRKIDITSNDCTVHPLRGKANVLRFLLLAGSLAANFACTSKKAELDRTEALKFLVWTPPLSLNPRTSIDGVGQQLGALLFRALTRLDQNLSPQADLASDWSVSQDGRTWIFLVKEGLADHSGQAITAERIVSCLENYRNGKPLSPLVAGFPDWIGTENQGARVLLKLKNPDPYLAKNLSLLRYFRTSGSSEPCREPGEGEEVIGSGIYRMKKWNAHPESDALFVPAFHPAASELRPIHFTFNRDDNSRALKLIRNQVDVVQNSLSLAKTRWIQKKYDDRYDVIEREGINVSYLAFNTEDALLSQSEVRRAIAHAIHRHEIVEHKFFGFGEVAGSFLSPLLPESFQVQIGEDLSKSRRLLDQAGFPENPDGKPRMELSYKTTMVREGLETAQIIQKMLARVGIAVKLQVVEPAVFTASIQKGDFQLFSSRWVGVSDGSILYRTLHSKQNLNRARYKNPEMDRILEKAIREPDSVRRTRLWRAVQEKMMDDLPYFPLWYWKNAVIVRKDLAHRVKPRDLSLSGAYEPLLKLARRKSFHPGRIPDKHEPVE